LEEEKSPFVHMTISLASSADLIEFNAPLN